jgi:plastocyanin
MRTARTWFLVALIATLVTAGLALPASGGGQQQVTRVRMVDERFRPRNITIDRGTFVRWVNRDNLDHTSTGPGWNSGRLDPGDTFRRRFNQTGTFSYRCTIHLTMRGTIVVE